MAQAQVQNCWLQPAAVAMFSLCVHHFNFIKPFVLLLTVAHTGGAAFFADRFVIEIFLDKAKNEALGNLMKTTWEVSRTAA
jgi:hypothetical protein